MEVDEALAKLGTIGRWQVLYYTTISTFCMVPSCVHMLAINYIGKSVILSLETVSSLEIVLTLETVLFCFYLRDALYSAIFAVVQCSSAPLSVRLSGGRRGTSLQEEHAVLEYPDAGVSNVRVTLCASDLANCTHRHPERVSARLREMTVAAVVR